MSAVELVWRRCGDCDYSTHDRSHRAEHALRQHQRDTGHRNRGHDGPPTRKTKGCICRNHMGTPKVQHRTRDDAMTAAVRQARAGRPARVYQCPTSDRWHVSTTPESTR